MLSARLAVWSVSGRWIEKGGNTMNLHKPTMAVFLVSLVIAVLALIGAITSFSFLSRYDFWIALLAYVVLAVGTLVET
jgi:hypothetical protein